MVEALVRTGLTHEYLATRGNRVRVLTIPYSGGLHVLRYEQALNLLALARKARAWNRTLESVFLEAGIEGEFLRHVQEGVPWLHQHLTALADTRRTAPSLEAVPSEWRQPLQDVWGGAMSKASAGGQAPSGGELGGSFVGRIGGRSGEAYLDDEPPVAQYQCVNPECTFRGHIVGVHPVAAECPWCGKMAIRITSAPDRQRIECLMAEGHKLMNVDVARAEATFRKVLEICPIDCNAWYNLGNCRDHYGDQDEAEKCYRQALTWNPKLIQAWNNLGSILTEQGRAAEADMCFDEGIKVNPNYPKFYLGKANVAGLRGDRISACIYLRQALEKDPHYAPAQHALRQMGCRPDGII
jgi:tetratricopeptide (TPR) repeat protein